MRKLVLIAFVAMLVGVVNAQNPMINKYKSSFTLNFIRYIGWPDDAKQGDFVIGVLKNKPMADLLKTQAGSKKFGYQNIVIKEFNTIEEVSNCQVLYVAGGFNFNKNAETIAGKMNGNNTLIITERGGAIKNGAMINFVVIDNKLKFEVSPDNAEKFGLKFSSTLLSMSNAIKV